LIFIARHAEFALPFSHNARRFRARFVRNDIDKPRPVVECTYLSIKFRHFTQSLSFTRKNCADLGIDYFGWLHNGIDRNKWVVPMPGGRENEEQLLKIVAELTRLRRLVPDDRLALADWIDKAICEASIQIERARTLSVH
jgi:hypothetical protein